MRESLAEEMKDMESRAAQAGVEHDDKHKLNKDKILS